MTATSKRSEERIDIYAKVTNRIVADLERGVRTWLKPWSGEHAAGRITRPLRHNGIPYQGMNIILLWAEAAERGFACPIWMTYRQAQALDGQVRKGEKSTQVVFADKIRRTEVDQDGQEFEAVVPYLKAYSVFNCEQVDGLPAQYYAPATPVLDPVQRIARAEAFFAATRADVRHGGDRAYYAIHADYVQMPPFECFRDAESFYPAFPRCRRR